MLIIKLQVCINYNSWCLIHLCVDLQKKINQDKMWQKKVLFYFIFSLWSLYFNKRFSPTRENEWNSGAKAKIRSKLAAPELQVGFCMYTNSLPPDLGYNNMGLKLNNEPRPHIFLKVQMFKIKYTKWKNIFFKCPVQNNIPSRTYSSVLRPWTSSQHYLLVRTSGAPPPPPVRLYAWLFL